MLSAKLLLRILADHSPYQGDDIRALEAAASSKGVGLEEYITSRAILREEKLYELAAKSLEIPFVRLSRHGLQRDASFLLPRSLARNVGLVCHKEEKGRAFIATANQRALSFGMLEYLERAIGKKPVMSLATPRDIAQALLLLGDDEKKSLPAESSPPAASQVILQVPPAIREKVSSFAQGPGGMVLLLGPAGAGKRSTLYGLAEALGIKGHFMDPSPMKKLPNLSQVTAPRAYRKKALDSIMRHDPDAVVIPNLAGAETSRAIDAARSGRLVLASSQEQLGKHIGVPWLTIHQRALRKLCPYCTRTFKSSKVHRQKFAAAFGKESPSLPDTLYKGQGCDRCSGGHLGLIPLFVTGNASPEKELLEQALRGVRCGIMAFDEMLALSR